eukprot:TRINITY_DN12732_c0_g1_i2.p1 TRINITY_DN12732_c0_g1~~TRINITY_DN12732_c0_g1_i2.p1  ORF type:complete len:263 (+),score=45.65 TRINITY_DN12732_c0_g1_i2:83-790(+)
MAKPVSKSKAKQKAKAKAKATTHKNTRNDKGSGKKLPVSGEEVMKRFEGKVVPVIKVDDAEHAVPLVKALLEGGIDIAEITFRTPCAGEAIRRASMVPGVFVGAGTVVDPKQVDVAVDAGANFVISPGFSDAVAARCKKRKILYIPGVITPTEVMTVTSKWGLKFLKFAPAGNFGGADTIKSYTSFFPDVKWMPTGTWFVSDASIKKAAESGDWTALTEGARKAKTAADLAKMPA